MIQCCNTTGITFQHEVYPSGSPVFTTVCVVVAVPNFFDVLLCHFCLEFCRLFFAIVLFLLNLCFFFIKHVNFSSLISFCKIVLTHTSYSKKYMLLWNKCITFYILAASYSYYVTCYDFMLTLTNM